MARALLFSGFDLNPLELKEDSLYEALLPLPAVGDFPAAVARALEEPVDGIPLSQRVSANSRVTILVDDFSLPVPAARQDPRREMLEVVLAELAQKGILPRQIRVLIGNGLSRKWRPIEVAEWLGEKSATEVSIICHDAEAQMELVRIADLPEAPVEVNRALVECDLVVHLNVVGTPVHAGWLPIVSGATGYRTARFLNAPKLFVSEEVPLSSGSAYQRVHDLVGHCLGRKVQVLQCSTVLNNDLFSPTLKALFSSKRIPTRRLSMWNALPTVVRQRVGRQFRASQRPIAVLSGSPDAVVGRARQAFLTQHERRIGEESEVILFGLPDIGPASLGTSQNPVLAASLALGYVANLATSRPLLKSGGVVIFANPLTPNFDKAHLPHQEFYEKALREEHDAQRIAEKFEAYFEGKPEFVNAYQRRYAFHGAHPLFAWSLASAVRKRARAVIAVHGDPRACARLGFTPANNFDDARKKAADALGRKNPRVTVLGLPPPFWLNVGSNQAAP